MIFANKFSSLKGLWNKLWGEQFDKLNNFLVIETCRKRSSGRIRLASDNAAIPLCLLSAFFLPRSIVARSTRRGCKPLPDTANAILHIPDPRSNLSCVHATPAHPTFHLILSLIHNLGPILFLIRIITLFPIPMVQSSPAFSLSQPVS